MLVHVKSRLDMLNQVGPRQARLGQVWSRYGMLSQGRII
jgi:hypothetical protein